MEPGRGSKPRRADRLAASTGLWLFLLLLAVFALTNRGGVWSSDAAMRLGMARHLLDTGTVGVPADLEPHLGSHGGKLVWGLGHALALIPAVLAGRALAPLAQPVLADRAEALLSEAFASFNSALTGALTCLLVYMIGRRLRYPRGPCVLAALALGLATTWWPYTQDAFYEPLQGMCLAAGLLLILKARKDRRARFAVCAGLCLGFAVLTKLTNLAVAAPLLLALVPEDRRRRGRRGLRQLALCVVLGALPLLALQVWSDQQRYGEPFPSPADRHPQYAKALRGGDLGRGLVSLTTGLQEGLLWYSPATLAALCFLPGVGKRDRFAALGVGLAVLVGILATARVTDAGLRGVCWGPRYLVPLFPLAALGFLPWFESLRGRGKAPARVATGVVLGLAVLVQVLALSVHYHRYYAETAALQPELARRLPFSFPLARQCAYFVEVAGGMALGEPHQLAGEAKSLGDADLLVSSRALNVFNFWWVLAYYQGAPPPLIAACVLALVALAGLSGRMLRPGRPARAGPGAEGAPPPLDEPW